MTGIRRMPCIQTFIVRQRVIGELPDSIHNVVPKRADIGQITVLNAVYNADEPELQLAETAPLSGWLTMRLSGRAPC